MRSICADLVAWCAVMAGVPAFASKVPQLESLPCVLVYRPEEAKSIQQLDGEDDDEQRIEKFKIEVHSPTALQADSLAVTLHDALRNLTGVIKVGSELELEAVHADGFPTSDTLTTPDGTDVGCHLCGFPVTLFVKVS